MAKKSFEESMQHLEDIINQLESGDLPLEKALKTFEEGVKISKYCRNVLDETEKKVALLLRENDGEKEVPFSDDAKE